MRRFLLAPHSIRRLLTNESRPPTSSSSRICAAAAGVMIGTSTLVLWTEENKEDTKPLGAALLHYGWKAPNVVSCEEQILLPAQRASPKPHFCLRSNLRRQRTVKVMEETATKNHKLEDAYNVNWRKPIGEGAFGMVFQATDVRTQEPVAVKEISKRHTDNESFENEMNALLLIQHQTGGHPNICSLREHFEQDGNFYLVLDLVQGGEMFDHLVDKGPYSEADAARLFRQIASALALLHGTGIVHSDLKPENLMMSTLSTDDAAIKIVDFGCATIIDHSNMDGGKETGGKQHRRQASTPAYSPPEVMRDDNYGAHAQILPSFDMWSLGVILYVMLTGVHPFDPFNDRTQLEVQQAITSAQKIPLRDTEFAYYLSPDAITVIEGLMNLDPKQRWTADQLLEHPWVQGKTASTKRIQQSNERLATITRQKTRVATNFFRAMIKHSDAKGGSDAARRSSVLESAFRDLGNGHNIMLSGTNGEASNASLSFSEAADLLSENMKDRYFKKGEIIYKEGDRGDSMYFINSGTVEATCSSDGYKKQRKAGEIIGTSALLNDDKKRSRTVKSLSHVHLIEISRESFEKYVKADLDVQLTMTETGRVRQREGVATILSLQKNLKSFTFKKDDIIFEQGSEGDMLYILEDGKVDLFVNDNLLRSLKKGEMTGEHAAFHKNKPYNVTAKCVESQGCTLSALTYDDMHALFDKNPDLRKNFQDIILRRDFKKAIVAATKKSFPETEEEMKIAFDTIDVKKSGEMRIEEIRNVMLKFDPSYSDADINSMLKSLDLNKSGTLTWAEFKNIFGLSKEA